MIIKSFSVIHDLCYIFAISFVEFLSDLSAILQGCIKLMENMLQDYFFSSSYILLEVCFCMFFAWLLHLATKCLCRLFVFTTVILCKTTDDILICLNNFMLTLDTQNCLTPEFLRAKCVYLTYTKFLEVYDKYQYS